MLLRLTAALAVPATITLTLTAFEQPALTTIRAVTSAPDQFVNRPVTLTGRFRGRTAPAGGAVQPLNRSRWDFLLKSSDDAVVWISGIRPAWWDFDLDPRTAMDSSPDRWLAVTGTVRVKRGGGACSASAVCPHVWIEASDLRPAAMQPFEPVLRPAVYPPTVVFNDPISDERNVPRSTRVRLQFSRNMIGETFSEHVRVSYASPRQLSAAPIPNFSAVYQDETRALELTFTAPLDRHEIVKVELLDGITARNGRPLAPWAFTFTTGE
jgi:hypothetical protein